jgi:hypothetical protein
VEDRKVKRTAIGIVGLLAAAAGTNADPTVFFGEDLNPGGSLAGMVNSQAARANFLSNLVGVGTEDFESIAVQDYSNQNVNLNFGTAGTATLFSQNFASVRNAPSAGRFATSGTNYFQTRAGSNDVFEITFTEDIAAFGFYGTDFGDFSGNLMVELTNGSTTTIDIPHTVNAPNGAGLFFGLIAFNAGDTFSKVTFQGTTTADVFGFDDLTIGTIENVIIPLPSAAGMALAGFGLVAVRRRRA